MTSAPIRQPRGPPSDTSQSAFALSPPAADQESLRRANTFSTTRHQPSASVSSTPATTSAFHGHGQVGGAGGGGRFKVLGRFRSGSLSSTDGGSGLVRKGSGREAVRTEEVVVEDEALETGEGDPEAVGGLGNEGFAKGLSRQSSLPSRRFANPLLNNDAKGSMGPPPRPPRRIQVSDIPEAMSPPPPSSAHSASHSMSSLHMFSPPTQRVSLEEQVPQAQILSGAGVSRTQSLRNQAKHSQSVSLGRSSSLKDSEHTRSGHQPSYSLHASPYSPPTPPPASSTAALPPFQLGGQTGDIRRHQSLNNGGHGRRDRAERTGTLLSPDEQEIRKPEPSPASPIGPSMWSVQAGANGWTSLDQLSNSFDTLQLNRRIPDNATNIYQQPQQQRRTPTADLLPSMPMTAGPIGEPSWVASLVGHDVVPRPRSAHTPHSQHWQDQNAHRQQAMLQGQPRWDQPQLPLGYMQSPQQLLGAYGMPLKGINPNVNIGQYPGYATPPMGMGIGSNQGYMGSPMYQTPATTHMLGPQDQAVIELARSKGLNPATFNCRPPVARFFVIKSYTEADVQKSLKHEIWSSTVLGNKRLDTAFREFSKTGPIYLFFSVNGSRHFCGVAEMLTPVDESQNSTVWASDKWKGIFKVRWIFVRDVPSPALRHIRLVNTADQKPMTNSRDTQELHYEAGCEVLQIFLDHQTKSKTSLLQDFAYYEQLSEQRSHTPTQTHNVAPGQIPTPPPFPQQFQPPIPMGQGMVPPVPPIPSRFR